MRANTLKKGVLGLALSVFMQILYETRLMGKQLASELSWIPSAFVALGYPEEYLIIHPSY